VTEFRDAKGKNDLGWGKIGGGEESQVESKSKGFKGDPEKSRRKLGKQGKPHTT